jgi:hypothetical protein
MTHHETRMVVVGIALASLLAGSLKPSAAIAATKYWEPPDAIGNWNYAAYWDPVGVPVAGDVARIEAGGSGYILYCIYTNATNPLLNSVYIGNLSTGTAEGRIVQSQDSLHTGYEYCGYRGTGKHFQSGGSVTVDNTLYLGRLVDSYGYYELSNGTLSAGYIHVGYGGDGEFVQSGGSFTTGKLSVSNANYAGPYGVGTYDMQAGTLNASIIYLGGKQDGFFDQSGGTVNATGSGLTLGLDQYGGGYYTLTNGSLNSYRTRLSWGGSEFVHSGGTHTITTDLEVGYGANVLAESLYTLSGSAILNVGDDLYLGQSGHSAPGRYRQTSGTAQVSDMLVLAEPTGTFRLEGGTFTCGDVSNDGHYQQTGGTCNSDAWTNTYDFHPTGGVLNADQFTNESTLDAIIEGTADCRLNVVTGNDGRIWLKNGYLRGKHLGGGVYVMCAFTNHAHFEMDGGTFAGHFTNYGTFTYDGGNFSQSTFTNYGSAYTVYLNSDFTCRRVVNHGSLTLFWDRWLIANGTGYANAVENNGSLNMYPRTHLSMGTGRKLVNNGEMYAGAAGTDCAYIHGDLENHGYLLPCTGGTDPGHLTVAGQFTSFSGAELRIRVRGTGANDLDHVTIQGTATCAGSWTYG